MDMYKLKALIKFERKVYDVLEISFEKNHVITLFRGGLRNSYELSDVTFLPFIGLLDKNSTEIFEGDYLVNDTEQYTVIYDHINTSFIAINNSDNNKRTDIKSLIKQGYSVLR